MDRAKGTSGLRGGLALAGCLALSVFALLLWGKLKLVTGAPRTAYADPETKAPASTPAPTGAPEPAAPDAGETAERTDPRGG